MVSQLRNPFEQGPYVQMALLCERVLHETDGVSSIIRIVDVINHQERGPNPPEEMPLVHYPLTLVISLRSGRAKGRHEITVTPEQPSGETISPIAVSINLEGEGKGVNIVSRIDIPYKFEGLYWFNIRFDRELITRIPLEVRYSRMMTGPGTPGS